MAAVRKPVLLAASALALCAAVASPLQAASERVAVPLADGWKFLDGDSSEAMAPAFDDSGWQAVSVPHTWNRAGYYRHSLGGTNTRETVRQRQGIGWYRLHFRPAAAAPGSRQWLEFDAASRTAKVWLNGRYLGEHRGGFSRFRLDATAAMQAGDNVLVVRVDNTQPAENGPTADVLPLNGDFFVHGGLYRPVRLVTTAPLHIDMADAGGPGVRATTTAATGEAASVAVEVRVSNDTARAAAATVRVALVDRTGREVASARVPANVAAGQTGQVVATLAVTAPHLWQGVDDPYLYDLIAEVAAADGTVTDRLVQPYGLRTMAFDSQRGFLLNGKPYRLRGTGYHQDRDGKGWAISRADVEQDVRTLRDMGITTLRLTHYQHGQDIHEIADREGLVLWDELPLVSTWTLGKSAEATPALLANARQQLVELIRQNQNHAATALWSIANEVDFGNSIPGFLASGAGSTPPDPMALLAGLNQLAHETDPSRPTALATCCEAKIDTAGATIPLASTAVDLGGANRYFGWYYGQAEELGPHLDRLRAGRPAQPLSVTEYGAGGALTLHTDNPAAAPADSRGMAQPEEYESMVHEQTLPVLEARPWLYATWLWNSFDFSTRLRTEGDAQDINTKGLIAYDHTTRKDAFYFYKANWNPAPMVHITSARHVERAYPVTDVKVYSNLPVTELLLNGRSLGTMKDCPEKVCTWPAVKLDEGANALVARGAGTSGPVEDRALWHLAPAIRTRFAIDAGALVAGKGNGRLIGSDNWVEGGKPGTLDQPADFGRPARPAAITDTNERDALATFREGTFSYRVPVTPGRYRVTLWFATAAGAKPGTFSVRSGKKTLLKDFQPAIPASAAAARSQALTLKARDLLALDFVAGTGPARVSLIEIEKLR